MKAFLTGSKEHEWRWDLANFLLDRHIEVIDPVECLCAFKHFTSLEGCDMLIINLYGSQRSHLLPLLEMSYASKLAKEVMILHAIPHEDLLTFRFPYSKSFVNLQELKEYLSREFLANRSHFRMFG
ncbi:hypothetical protein CSA56_12580 [candidate division KSB3 bacterium]|uniref:Uncharacterized protein n=1 Tax=candidate division KSB3 bacterium TaxID=2044937 RepID=A0A2G6KEC3_9BACT|nr:MAG: hypothetical protein CSA56_12580 [candidate division KSB3 bacterium]